MRRIRNAIGWSGRREEFFGKRGLKSCVWRVFDKCCEAAVVWGLAAVIH
jgi:hypothetical protein